MRIVVPIIKRNPCYCPVDTLLIDMDAYGVKDLVCVDHGPLMTVDKLEFDSEADYEAWRAAQ